MIEEEGKRGDHFKVSENTAFERQNHRTHRTEPCLCMQQGEVQNRKRQDKSPMHIVLFTSGRDQAQMTLHDAV